jgi:hypothetical protein
VPRSRNLATPIKRASVAVAALIVTSGCATWPERPEVSAAHQAAAELPGYATPVRFWVDAPLEDWRAWRDRWAAENGSAHTRSPETILAISSGSDKGAFAAGYLNGWTQSGSRPRFTVVTGVSTGALIAPFAFLGSDYDAQLSAIYTGVEAGDIFRSRPIAGLFGGPALADSRPLARLIARYVTHELLDRIAAEHRTGRRLLIMTTNLDAGRGVAWDLGEIAASGHPDKLSLFRRLLLASASVPGVFPPVLIDVVAGPTRFAEMHVDGGTVGSVFVLPQAIMAEGAPALGEATRGTEMTLLYNGALDRDYQVVKPRTFAIISRALTTVVGEADRQSIQAYRQFAERSGITLRVEAIGPDFATPSTGLFDQRYMRSLFAHGAAAGRRATSTTQHSQGRRTPSLPPQEATPGTASAAAAMSIRR